ncbi:MAG: 1-deoxy-D-xylulose-5-phosphate reductoisomerase, partial [Francisellaceae bacterium]
VDSEHNAIFQCLPAHNPVFDSKEISEIILTASGGPFRTKPIDQLSIVTPDQACAHPNWEMGRKISVDSATMMNKSLEVIEAYWLFNVPTEQLSVLIHPQSIVHSMVKYSDGSFLAQLGSPDMRTPIGHALYYPGRGNVEVKPLDLTEKSLDFERVDNARFPSIQTVFSLLKHQDYVGTIIFNAVNELMVERFLHNKIKFTDIVKNVNNMIEKLSYPMPRSIEDVISLDKEIRSCVIPTH